MADSRTPKLSVQGPSSSRRSALRFIVAALFPPAVALVVVVLFLRASSWWPAFILGVIVSAWLGGKTSGLTATFASTVLAWYFIIPPRHSFAPIRPGYFIGVALFITIGIVVSLMHEQLSRARRQAEDALGEASRTNSALRRSLADLNESRLLIQAVIDNSPGIIVVKDTEGRLLLFNKQFEEHLGLDHDAARGRTVYDLFPADVAERRRATDQTIVRTRAPVTLEETVEIRGEKRILLASAFPLVDEHGTLFAVAWIETDITDRKKAETALRQTALDLAEAQRVGRIGSWYWDMSANTMSWSHEMYRLHGWDSHLPPPDVDGLLRLFAPESMQAIGAAFDKVRTEGTAYELELETVQGEDGTRWIRDRAEAVRDDTGRITGVRGISQDITAIKNLQQLREEWLSVIAHDLRQPIGAIKMAAQLLPDLHVGKMTEGEAAITARVGSAAQSLARMVDDLLDASRLETKRLALERSWVKPHDIVADAIARVAHLTTGCAVKVAEHDTPPQVFADPVRFTQVLGNLISNAAKYGEKNGDIEVQVAGNTSELHVTVTNRGRGIPPDEARRLFSRFARLASAHKSSVKGMGLGLYIAKGIVEAHGGRMWVDSVPNETTTFHFTLPVQGSGKAAA